MTEFHRSAKQPHDLRASSAADRVAPNATQRTDLIDDVPDIRLCYTTHDRFTRAHPLYDRARQGATPVPHKQAERSWQ